MSSSTEQVKGFDTEELINFLKGRNLHLNETHYNSLRHKEIAGSDFLNYTREELKGLGLAIGPTKRIEQLINELNTQSNGYDNEKIMLKHGYGCVRGNKEDNRLVAVINRFGSRNWNRIARKMGNRNPIECQRRWNLINFNANRPSRNGTRSLHHRNTCKNFKCFIYFFYKNRLKKNGA
ncbi:hypothetical protein RhiirB3_479353 [Rhizophagus irregularis]|nr:hypothetical protein RhiirB3_479353 [Rhizophagus irregularis]